MKNNTKFALKNVQNLLQDIESIDNIKVEDKKDTLSKNLTLKQVITDAQLYKAVHKLFEDGHHAQAVTQGCKYLDNLVAKKSAFGASGEGLMQSVFSPKKPILQINDMTNQSEEDEQRGHMALFAGVMAGVRNPRVHEHDWEDTELRAIQLLSFINYLVSRVRSSTKNP